jgi:hypothetical protein
MENNELKKLLFDIKKYRVRPANLITNGTISKSGASVHIK